MFARSRMAAVGAVVALATTGCPSSVGREPVPKALAAYLEAVKDGELQKAYRLTQLEQLRRAFGRGAALTYEHFAAFHQASRLEGYEVRKVTRLEQRSINAPRQSGTPFFVVDVVLEYGYGERQVSFDVEGEVVGTVTVEPDRVFVETPEPVTEMIIDGVRTDVSRSLRSGTASTYQLLVLVGRHEISTGGAAVAFSTSPLAVVSGSATVEGNPPRLVLG